MTEGDAAAGAVRETTVFLSYFEALPDYRQKGKVAYPLDEVLLLMLAATLAGAETVADIARFGRATAGSGLTPSSAMSATPSSSIRGTALTMPRRKFIACPSA